jgi:hypothetical protein
VNLRVVILQPRPLRPLNFGGMLILWMVACFLPGCCMKQRAALGRNQETAYFGFTDDSAKELFVMKLTNSIRINEARDILSGKQTRNTHPMGLVVMNKADYNPHWSYHLEPDSIAFVENTVEISDATVRYVEDHLGEVGGSFLPGSIWCAWKARLIREMPTAGRQSGTAGVYARGQIAANRPLCSW